jgi:hypothetical protein
MSEDQLDKEFKARVKQVFDNYEDDSGAEGWAMLREKFPEKESNRAVVLLWRYVSAAAVLLAILSVALWFNQKHDGNNIVVKNNTHKTVAPIKIAATTPKYNENINKAKTNIAYQTPVKSANTTHSIVNSSPAFTPAITKLQARNSVQPNANNATTPAVNNVAAVKPVVINSPQYSNGSGTKGVVTGNKPGVITTPANSLNNTTQNAISSTQQPVNPNTLPFATIDTTKPRRIIATNSNPQPAKTSETPGPKKTGMESLFANDSKYNAAQNNKSDVKIKNRKVVFGVYAATYVNYAQGSNNQFNTGAGISTDIRLTENLSIATGISIAQNSFSYNNISASSSVMFPAALSHDFAANSALSLAQVVPPSKNLDASLVGLDVPIDLKYMFNPQRSSAYLSAGFSSGAFINETYNYTYSYSVDNSPSNQESQGATSRKSFNDFYFAKMLNVAFGIGYPLGKGNQLIVEPFRSMAWATSIFFLAQAGLT